jgi:hypothetical protein
MAMAQRERGNGVLDLAWSTIAFGDQHPYAFLWHSQDRSASRSGTHGPASGILRPTHGIEGQVSLSTRRRHNPIQFCITERCGSIAGSYWGHDTAIFVTSALEDNEACLGASVKFQLTHPSHTSWPTMSIRETATQPCLTYKEMMEIVEMVRWTANVPGAPVNPPEPVYFPYPLHDSASDHSTRRPTTPLIHKHAHHLYEAYNLPAHPGEWMFKEMILHGRRRKFVRIIDWNAPHVMTEVDDFLEDPDIPNARYARVQKRYLMGDGYVDFDPAGFREHLLVTAWRLRHPVITWARRAKVAVKATLLKIWGMGLDVCYGPTYDAEEGFERRFEMVTT